MGKFNEIEWIFFDLGNVLFRLDFEAVWNELKRETGSDVELIKEALYEKDVFNAFETGKISPEKYHRCICEKLKKNIEYKTFVDIWNSIIVPDVDMLKLARYLKRNYKILILSNTNVLNASVMEEVIREIADEVVYSYMVGYMKPDENIYKIALAKAKSHPNSVLFVDDMDENIDAAKKIGINTYLFYSIFQFYNFLKDKNMINIDISHVEVSGKFFK